MATCAAKTLKIPREQVLRDAGVTLLGTSSLKAALDIDWGNPAAQAEALARLLGEVDRLEQWVARHVPVADAPPVRAALTALRRVLTRTWNRIRRPGCGAFGGGWPPSGCPRWATRRCGMGGSADAPVYWLQAACDETGGRM